MRFNIFRDPDVLNNNEWHMKLYPDLNVRARMVAWELIDSADSHRCQITKSPCGGTIIDCGVGTLGGLGAGLSLAQICLSDLAQVSLHPSGLPGCALVQVRSDLPVLACLASQYAGWQLKYDNFFAMGSGPMRAAYAKEALFASKEILFADIEYYDEKVAAVGILESKLLPTDEVLADIACKCGVTPHEVYLLVAPTTSIAGSLQVVARSVETALHKLHELKFHLKSIVSAIGTAPLPPIAKKTNTAIGYTNDAILYGGDVTLWVQCEDDVLSTIGPKVPASASSDYGVPFAELFERVGGDFYQIDPLLFSPARITFHNLNTGRSHTFGKLNLPLLERSWGLHS